VKASAAEEGRKYRKAIVKVCSLKSLENETKLEKKKLSKSGIGGY